MISLHGLVLFTQRSLATACPEACRNRAGIDLHSGRHVALRTVFATVVFVQVLLLLLLLLLLLSLLLSSSSLLLLLSLSSLLLLLLLLLMLLLQFL